MTVKETIQTYLDNDARNVRDLRQSPDARLQHLSATYCAQHLFWAESLGDPALTHQAWKNLKNALADLGLSLFPQ
jgi:hypothetical protein